MPRPRRDAPLHVLDAVLRWPPETFLQWKFERLAEHGVRVTVASTVPRRKAGVRVRGAELLRVPSWREPAWSKVLGGIWDGLVLLLRHPGRVWRLIRAVRGPLPPSPSRTPWRTTGVLLRRYLRLARLRPDIVHFEWETAAGHYLPLMDVWSCPVVVSCRGREIHVLPHAPGNEVWVSRLPAVFAKAAAIHCVSEAIREEGVRYGLDVEKAWLIRPAVDVAYFRPAGGPGSAGRQEGQAAFEVISVADLIWPKGFEYALAAVGRLAREGVPIRLRICGDGIERDRILGTVADLGLHEHVELAGRLTREGIRDALQRSDAFLHASLAEGIPNVMLEAMACGLAVVVTDCGGTAEAVRDGREGLVVPTRDPGAMAGALAALWRHPSLRADLGRAARERVEEAFALEAQVQRILAMYESVTAPAAGVRP